MIAQEFMYYLQVSPGRVSYFFPHTGNMKQIHTHEGPPTSLCSFVSPYVISIPPSPSLVHQEDATEEYLVPQLQLWYLLTCVLIFHFSAS
jgi:hypothetical protein